MNSPAATYLENYRHGGIIDSRPIPLAERHQALEFPVEALGPILGEAAECLAYHIQTPFGMAGQSVLSAAALAVQGHTDVSRGNFLYGPTSLFCMTVASSGDRKSAIDKNALHPIREYEEERRAAYKKDMADFKASKEAWSLHRKSIISSHKNTEKSPISEADEKRMREALAEVNSREPSIPPRPHITLEEPTAEGIYRHLLEGQPTAGLFNSEGIGFFGGHGMSEENRGRTIAMLSKLWDGDPITRTRGAEGDSGILAGKRLSAHLMMQPVVADQVLRDPLLHGQGFLARFLIVQEPSLAGQRFTQERDLNIDLRREPALRPYYEALSQQIRRPLNVSSETGEIKPHNAKIEGDALEAWCILHDGIEAQTAESGEFFDIREFAAKGADNAARIAAILAQIDGHEKPLVKHIESAGKLVTYYLNFMAIRVDESRKDKNELIARDLLDFIKSRGGFLHSAEFKYLPRNLRNAKLARQHLKTLVEMGHLEIYRVNQHGKAAEWRIRGNYL